MAISRDGALATAAYTLDASFSAEPCLLRFDTTEMRFDAGFRVNTNELLPGFFIGDLIPGPRNTVFVRYLDSALIEPDDLASPQSRRSGLRWGWAKISLSDQPSVEPMAVGLESGADPTFAIDGTSYLSMLDGYEPNSTSRTRVARIGEDGPAETLVRLPGHVVAGVLLR